MSAEIDLSRVAELSALAVPPWVQGVWQRKSIRTNGDERREPYVVWVQTPTLYADIRVLRPEVNSPPGTTSEGFAGWLHVKGQICHWKRPIDLNPRPPDSDQSAMFVNRETMLEIGLFSNFLEEYQRIESAQHCFAASRGAFTVDGATAQFEAQQPLEILVCVGSYVTHARHAGTSAVRHGRYDASSGVVNFHHVVGEPTVLTNGSGCWTVWTDDVPDRNALLAGAATG